MGVCESPRHQSSDHPGARGAVEQDPVNTRPVDDDFVALLTEELRTNLQAMLGFTQLMQRDQKEPLSERQRERVNRVLDAGEHLVRVLNDACALARIQAGQLPMLIQAVDVNRLFERVRAELEPVAVSRKLELVIGRSPSTQRVSADARALTEIVVRLAANAVAYNKPHGSVILQASPVVAPMMASPIAAARLRISVVDTGIGVPLEEQHKLFRPFPRVAREAPGSEGAGLGLVTCRALAAGMGASVGFRSAPARGSEFWVDVPAFAG